MQSISACNKVVQNLSDLTSDISIFVCRLTDLYLSLACCVTQSSKHFLAMNLLSHIPGFRLLGYHHFG